MGSVNQYKFCKEAVSSLRTAMLNPLNRGSEVQIRPSIFPLGATELLRFADQSQIINYNYAPPGIQLLLCVASVVK